MTYKSSFQDRAAQAAEAKAKALEKHRSRPPIDEKTAADRRAAGLKQEMARAQKAAVKRAAMEARVAEEAAKAAATAPASEAELKAARDARYAARKSRK